MIESSNFVSPFDLKGHHQYSFDAPGSTSLATSEPEKVEKQEFPDRYRDYLDASDPIPLSEIIKRASKTVQETIDTSADPHRFFCRIMSDTIQERIRALLIYYRTGILLLESDFVVHRRAINGQTRRLEIQDSELRRTFVRIVIKIGVSYGHDAG